jgi:hypothetical protein
VKLVGKIQVEALDDERLTNIERRVVAGAAERIARPTRAPRHGLAFASALLAAGAAGVLGWQLHRTPERAPSTVQRLAIATDDHASRLALDGATVASSPGAVFEVVCGEGRVDIALAHGKLELAVEHRADRVLIVHAGETEVEDVGTRFSVAYDGASHARIEVAEGQVKVTRQRRSELVVAGHAWATDSGPIALAVPPPPAATTGPRPSDDADAGRGARDLSHPVAVDEHRVPPEPAVAPQPPPPTRRAPPPPRPRPAPPHDDLHARLASHAPELVIDLPLADYPIRAANETHLDAHANLLFSWAVKAYQGAAKDARLYDLADHVLDGLVAKRAGTRYVDALWLRLRIRCRRGYDDRCRDTARDYIAANGPLNDLAQDILSAP